MNALLQTSDRHRIIPIVSLGQNPGLTRASVFFVKGFYEDGWIAGS
jgi:hypothetical protein